MEPCFNAIIEGYNAGSPRESLYKLTNIIVPESAALLHDGTYAYRLVGLARDFRVFDEISSSFGNEVPIFEVGRSTLLNGLVIPYKGGFPSSTFDRPRSIWLRGGRVFTSEDDAGYIEFLKRDGIENIKCLFNEPNIDELYRRVVLANTQAF